MGEFTNTLGSRFKRRLRCAQCKRVTREYSSFCSKRCEAAAEVRAAVSGTMVPRERCPDDGRCHHNCKKAEACFRVRTCAPLSGVYMRDTWPEALRRKHASLPLTIGEPDE